MIFGNQSYHFFNRSSTRVPLVMDDYLTVMSAAVGTVSGRREKRGAVLEKEIRCYDSDTRLRHKLAALRGLIQNPVDHFAARND